LARHDISAALEALLNAGKVVVNRPAVFRAGGGFADRLIAYQGSGLGGDILVSFDRKAVPLIAKHWRQARSLA
jgi:predicted nucleic-acid-binding protein